MSNGIICYTEQTERYIINRLVGTINHLREKRGKAYRFFFLSSFLWGNWARIKLKKKEISWYQLCSPPLVNTTQKLIIVQTCKVKRNLEEALGVIYVVREARFFGFSHHDLSCVPLLLLSCFVEIKRVGRQQPKYICLFFSFFKVRCEERDRRSRWLEQRGKLTKKRPNRSFPTWRSLHRHNIIREN